VLIFFRVDGAFISFLVELAPLVLMCFDDATWCVQIGNQKSAPFGSAGIGEGRY
jgi:hypothetical protein